MRGSGASVATANISGVIPRTSLAFTSAPALRSAAIISGEVTGAVISAVLGVAFAVSAAMNRPLTRAIALRLSTECPDSRRHLAERWGQKKALDIFKVLSFGWAILLLLSAGQQIGLAF